MTDQVGGVSVGNGKVARLAGLEPTASASAGLRSIQLSYKRTIEWFPGQQILMVPKEGVEPTHP